MLVLYSLILQYTRKNLAAIKRIRHRQFSPMSLFGVCASVLCFLLASEAVPWNWEFIFIGGFGLEIMGTVSAELFSSKPRQQATDSSDKDRKIGALMSNVVKPVESPLTSSKVED